MSHFFVLSAQSKMAQRGKEEINMTYLGNAFSLQMMDTTDINQLIVTPVEAGEVATSGFTSVVGHQDTANVLADMLGVPVEFNRVSMKLKKGDILYVGQVVGGRLPEGAVELPEGFSIKFLKVEIEIA